MKGEIYMAKEIKTIGVLTSGGDAPGMNAAIRAVVRTSLHMGIECVGIRRGYHGLINGDFTKLTFESVSDLSRRGGTMLYSARSEEFKTPAGQERAVATCKMLGLDALVGIGGDGTFSGLLCLAKRGLSVVGIPGTIDNDIACSSYTIGYDTACNTALESIDKLRDTMQSHERCSVVEVMGRHCGDIALKAAAGSGAEICLVPEVPWSIQEAADRLSRLIDMGNPRATVVVAEGAWDSMQPADWRRYLIESGVKGIHEDDPINTEKLALLLKHKCKCEARPTVLGYTQRGRTPSAYDSWFAFEAGNLAVNLLRNGIGNQVIGIKDGRVYYLPIAEALKQKREFNLSLYNMINSL